MEPETFGPFLKQARSSRGMTQAQLAGRLHVSTAAVSKWERSKCLPDVAKLEEMAQALDLSVLEVMKCQVSEDPLPAQELREVYTQTLKTARTQSRNKGRKAAMIVCCAALLLAAFHYFPVYRIALVWKPSCFDTGEVSQLAYIGSREDRRTAQEILFQAEQAFSDLSSAGQAAAEQYGLLGRYSITYPGVVEQRHRLKLWSAHFGAADGCMWVCYSQEGRDAEGGVVTGSWNIPSLWYLKKGDDGEWKVAGIKEHP